MNAGSPLPFLVGIALLSSACAATSKTEAHPRIAPGGPAILNPRAQPGFVDLRNRPAMGGKPEISAEVLDARSRIDTVRLRLYFSDGVDERIRYFKAPLDIEMKPVGGAKWHAILDDRQLNLLAIAGESLTYNARVIARDEQGRVCVSNTPFEVTIRG
jgi:hypothetical protein